MIGHVLNHDTFSTATARLKEQLRSFVKARDLKEFGFAPTPMPSSKGTLNRRKRRMWSALSSARGQVQSMMAPTCLLVLLLSMHGTSHVRASTRRDRAAELARYSGHGMGQRYSPLTEITSANTEPGAEMDLAGPVAREVRSHALVVDGVILHGGCAERRCRAQRRDRSCVLDLFAPARDSCAILLRQVNRGLAILGDTLYVIDPRVSRDGARKQQLLIWDTTARAPRGAIQSLIHRLHLAETQ